MGESGARPARRRHLQFSARRAAVVVVVAALVASCSGDEASTTSTTSATPDASSSSTESTRRATSSAPSSTSLTAGSTTTPTATVATVGAAVATHGTLTVDGRERTYRLYVPASLPTKGSVPLVVGLHGGLGNADQFAEANHVEEVAEEGAFVAVFPDGVGLKPKVVQTWNGGDDYCCGPSQKNGIDDVAYLRALVAHVGKSYRIDADRVFAIGHSNGGIMSYRLACEASDLFAAIGVVAGSLGVDCDPSQPVSLVHLHGDADENHPIDGGVGTNGVSGVAFRSAYDSVEEMAAVDGCDEGPTVEERPMDGETVEVRRWDGCAPGVDVEMLVIRGGSHAWPGAAARAVQLTGPPADLDGTRAIWSFLADHGR